MRPEILTCHNVPKPLHGVSPRTMLGGKWWSFARHLAYSRAGFCCQACGIPKSQAQMHQWLEAHEWIVPVEEEPGVYVVKEIVALCHYCHMFIHSGRLSIVEDEPTEAILRHGVKVLRLMMDKPRIFYTTLNLCERYGVSTRGLGVERPTEPSIAWSAFRLRYKEHEWPAKFNSADEWLEYYNQ